MLVPVVHASDLSLGVGIGRPFGIGGVNGAYTLTDHLQVAAGIGNGKLLFSGESNYSLGINYYFGEITDKWRKRIGVNYNEYQESGIQVEHRSSKGEITDSTSSESRFKGIELDLGMRRLMGGKRNRSFEFGTTIPLIKEKTEDDELSLLSKIAHEFVEIQFAVDGISENERINIVTDKLKEMQSHYNSSK